MPLPPYNWRVWKNPGYTPPDSMEPYFAEQVAAWSKHIQPGDHCIDIGAMNGDTTLPMAICAGPHGRVIAFEPNNTVLPITRYNCQQATPIAPIILVEAAVDIKVGIETFYYNDYDYCNGGKPLPKRNYTIIQVAPQRVVTVPLRPFLTHLVRFIKIDTEGNDHRILAPCHEELRRWRPVIQTEFYPDLTANEREDYASFLLCLGYNLFHCDGLPATIPNIIKPGNLDIIAA